MKRGRDKKTGEIVAIKVRLPSLLQCTAGSQYPNILILDPVSWDAEAWTILFRSWTSGDMLQKKAVNARLGSCRKLDTSTVSRCMLFLLLQGGFIS